MFQGPPGVAEILFFSAEMKLGLWLKLSAARTLPEPTCWALAVLIVHARVRSANCDF